MNRDHVQIDAHTGIADTLDVSMREIPPPPCVDPLSFLSNVANKAGLKPVPNYLGCIGALAAPTNYDAEDLARGHIPALRDARLFDMGMTLHEFHKKACEIVCNLYELSPPPPMNKRTTQSPDWLDYAKLYQAFVGGVYKLPAAALPKPPTKLPFKSMFLHTAGPMYAPFGSAIRLSNGDPMAIYTQESFLKKEACGMPLGFLVSDSVIAEYVMAYRVNQLTGQPDGRSPMITFAILHWTAGEGWLKPQTLVPWIISLMVGYLNSHNTVVHGRIQKREQHDIMKQSKKLPGGHVRPRDFYTLTMHRQTFDESAFKVRKSMESRARKYRIDVRGHETVRVLRGQLPIDPKDEKKLRERGYRIYIETDLSEDDRLRLEHRDMPPRKPGEWIAVLSWWRESFMSPSNPALPYVPAVRRPTEPVARGES